MRESVGNRKIIMSDEGRHYDIPVLDFSQQIAQVVLFVFCLCFLF
jgi:hypothetical protein